MENIDAVTVAAYSNQPPSWSGQNENERKRGPEASCSMFDILLVGRPIYRTVLAHEMHGSSQTVVGWSKPAVTMSQTLLGWGACGSHCEPSLVFWQ